MQIDVIIPAYNAHETIDKALASIAMQKIDPEDEIQVIIVNDASPDGSYHDCARYWAMLGLNIGVLDRKVNGGCGQARQSGIDAGDGDCFTCLDADDVLGSPFALRVFLDGMKLGYDLVMGQFIEETEKKTMVPHGANYVWMHGKCYSYKFVRENNLKFNLSRYNEDVAFNSIVHNITENVLYVPQTVYIWHNRADSTVRGKHDHYCHGYGWRAFIENMAWTEEELRKRGVEEEKILTFLSQAIARMYWNSQDGHEILPEEEEANFAAMRVFFINSIQPHADGLTKEKLREGYFKVAAETPMTSVPYMTFDDFLRKIGFSEVK